METTTTTAEAVDPRLTKYLTTCHVFTHGSMRSGTCGKPAVTIGARTRRVGDDTVTDYTPHCKFHQSVQERRQRRWLNPDFVWVPVDDPTAVAALTAEYNEKAEAAAIRQAEERAENIRRRAAASKRAIEENRVRFTAVERPKESLDYEAADRLTRGGVDRDEARRQAIVREPRWLVIDEAILAAEAEYAARDDHEIGGNDIAWKAANTVELRDDYGITTVRMSSAGSMNPSEARALATALMLAASEAERRNQ